MPVQRSTSIQEGKKIIWTNKTDGRTDMQTDDRLCVRSFALGRKNNNKKNNVYIRTGTHSSVCLSVPSIARQWFWTNRWTERTAKKIKQSQRNLFTSNEISKENSWRILACSSINEDQEKRESYPLNDKWRHRIALTIIDVVGRLMSIPWIDAFSFAQA